VVGTNTLWDSNISSVTIIPSKPYGKLPDNSENSLAHRMISQSKGDAKSSTVDTNRHVVNVEVVVVGSDAKNARKLLTY
jgi:hypothetical protein